MFRRVEIALVLFGVPVLNSCAVGLDVDLQGGWSATSYEFTETASPQSVVDIIQRDGAALSLEVDAAGVVVATFDDGIGSPRSHAGTVENWAQVIGSRVDRGARVRWDT